ncbi:rhodanese-like domain-containing protein [Accumulibacter sp.]|uniref:rhodanese-like domain-containing protein n=1 Tax=Accumulibacter sp. TaxID=2053492 RepID=UPI001A58D756|nr:rhodanese-like domain-containing protein [Accumulibacter sp.]MBL8373176.1 rhodanese-like domain-containing protein [Accumulibacter sp.]
MFTKSIAGLATVLALALAPALADEIKPLTPTSVKGARTITVEEAKGLLDKKAASFFDTRSPLNFGKGHLPGATLIAYKEKSEFALDFDARQDSFDIARLPADKNATIVIHSDGPSGWKSYKATVLAAKAGYRDVLWMRDGYAGWTAKGLPVEQ